MKVSEMVRDLKVCKRRFFGFAHRRCHRQTSGASSFFLCAIQVTDILGGIVRADEAERNSAALVISTNTIPP